MAEIDPHFREHDPILDANHCDMCNAALRHTFVLLADLDLAPNHATTLAKRIREIALGLKSPGWVDQDHPLGPRGGNFSYTVPRIEDVVDAEFVDAEIDIPLPPR